MSFTPQDRSEIIALYTGATGAAPGVAILSDLLAEFDAGASMADLSASIVASAEFQADFANTTNSEFAEQWVDSVVGEFVDAAAMEWAVDWATGKLNAGQSRGDLVLEALTALNDVEAGNDAWVNASAAFKNKADVAEYYVLELKGEGDVTERKAIVANVDETPESVEAGKGEAGITLAQGLQDLQTARDNLSEFLVSALDNELVAAEASATASTAAGADIQAALGGTLAAVDAALVEIGTIDPLEYYNPATPTSPSASVRSGMVDFGKVAAQDAIDTAETTLATNEAAVADGVLEGLATIEADAAAYGAAMTAAADANTAEDGEIAKFNAVNASALEVVGGAELTLGVGNGTDPATREVVATLDSTGQWVVTAEANVNFSNGIDATIEGYDDLVGFDDYIAALQLQEDTTAAEQAALESLQDAIIDVVNLENSATADVTWNNADYGDMIDDSGAEVVVNLTLGTAGAEKAPDAQAVWTAREGLEAANSALDNLNEAVADLGSVAALWAEFNALTTAEEEAEDALTDSVEDGGLGVVLLSGAQNFTADDDVYLFDIEGADVILNGFGASGEDKIFFGEGYTLAEIPEGSTIANNVGDQNVLEILWTQDGDDLILHVEAETFAGNSTQDADITTVKLVGVSAEDITFEGGFMTAGSAA